MKQAALDVAMALNFDAFRESYDPNEMSSKFGGQRFGNMNSGGATPRASIRLSSQLLIQSAMFTGSKYEYEYERSTSNNSSVSPNQDQNRNSLRRADAWNDDVRGEVSQGSRRLHAAGQRRTDGRPRVRDGVRRVVTVSR